MQNFIILAMCLISLTASAECNDNAKIRVVNSSNPKAAHLYEQIKGKFPSWRDEFHREEFTYLGTIDNGINLAWLYTSWGVSTCRGTTRLLLFRNEKFLGSYAMNPVDGEVILKGNKIVFPYDSSIGNVIDLSKGIPNEIWIDGELPMFMKSEL